MNERPTVTVPNEIEEAQLQFENWRRRRNRGQRIPENLWGTAVECRLKGRVGNGDDVNRGAFVELIPQGAMLCTCIVEMEDARGARMRIEVKGAAADVTALSRTFWSEGE